MTIEDHKENQLLLITGCQRSGTTLTGLILDSHSGITYIDEQDFKPEEINSYLCDKKYAPVVALKLPGVSHLINALYVKKPFIIWCERDPRDVITSMLRLKLELGTDKQALWALHPAGAMREIKEGMRALARENFLDDKDRQCLAKLKTLRITDPLGAHKEAVFLGAFCWRVKQRTKQLYERLAIPFFTLRYEELVQQPEHTLRKLFFHAKITWDEAVLQHHKMHKGVAVGGTIKERAIDPKNIQKWHGLLDEDDLAVIQDVCSDLGYEL